MEDDELENFDEQNENLGNTVQRYEEMLRNHRNYFFDVDALLRIIDYYIEKSEFDKAIEVAKYAANLHPNSIDFKTKHAHFRFLTLG